MDNYVLVYHFADRASEQRFGEEVKEAFWRHRVETSGQMKYFGFAGREEPGVVDRIKAIIDRLGIGTEDYVALYYSRDGAPDKIQRQMILGPDSLIEADEKEASPDAHYDSLTRLLEFDFVKAQPEPPGKK